MKEVELGKVFLPEAIIKEVEKHKKSMLLANSDVDEHLIEFMKNASFSIWFSDYLLKYGFKLLD